MSDSPSDIDAPDDNDAPDGSQDKNALEWAVTAVGALIVLFVLCFFVYEMVAGASGPANILVRLGEPSRNGETVQVPVEIRNTGERVAEAAVIEVCAGPEACAEITFDYVPYQSELTGVVGLDAPLPGPLASRVVSYRNP